MLLGHITCFLTIALSMSSPQEQPLDCPFQMTHSQKHSGGTSSIPNNQSRII